jgi:hypothetical protein
MSHGVTARGWARGQDFGAAMGCGGIVFLLSPKHTRQGEEVIAGGRAVLGAGSLCVGEKINREINGEEKETTAKN